MEPASHINRNHRNRARRLEKSKSCALVIRNLTIRAHIMRWDIMPISRNFCTECWVVLGFELTAVADISAAKGQMNKRFENGALDGKLIWPAPASKWQRTRYHRPSPIQQWRQSVVPIQRLGVAPLTMKILNLIGDRAAINSKRSCQVITTAPLTQNRFVKFDPVVKLVGFAHLGEMNRS